MTPAIASCPNPGTLEACRTAGTVAFFNHITSDPLSALTGEAAEVGAEAMRACLEEYGCKFKQEERPPQGL